MYPLYLITISGDLLKSTWHPRSDLVCKGRGKTLTDYILRITKYINNYIDMRANAILYYFNRQEEEVVLLGTHCNSTEYHDVMQEVQGWNWVILTSQLLSNFHSTSKHLLYLCQYFSLPHWFWSECLQSGWISTEQFWAVLNSSAQNCSELSNMYFFNSNLTSLKKIYISSYIWIVKIVYWTMT